MISGSTVLFATGAGEVGWLACCALAGGAARARDKTEALASEARRRERGMIVDDPDATGCASAAAMD
ncbi:hypothetical protein OCAR_7013 [Afipia carboxidovorans OM5]|nr:hypothetical protein OCAR_7013 [Afipia carboxidovorans OM5]